MNGYRITVALAAMCRSELVAEARRARLVEESRVAATQDRHGRGRSSYPVPRPSGGESAARIVARGPAGPGASFRHAQPARLVGDRR